MSFLFFESIFYSPLQKADDFFSLEFQGNASIGSNEFQCETNFSIKTCEIRYPCTSISRSKCDSYKVVFHPARYHFELYGGSGDGNGRTLTPPRDPDHNGECLVSAEQVAEVKGNVVCDPTLLGMSMPGSGGYTSGWLDIREDTIAYLVIGGQGSDGKSDSQFEGGYNGGGRCIKAYRGGMSSGGGATDLRFEADDLFHRALVAGGAGGSDDPITEGQFGYNDGSGGCGGNFTAQSYWTNGKYGTLMASQVYGFAFGQGEAANPQGSNHPNGIKGGAPDDNPGAGGGWYGGFSSQTSSGGAGGGSSYALTRSSEIPPDEITLRDENYVAGTTAKYAFNHDSKYCMEKTILLPGIWQGNGMARITAYSLTTANFSNIKWDSHAKKVLWFFELLFFK